MIVKRGVLSWMSITLAGLLLCCNIGCRAKEKPKSSIVIYTSLPQELVELFDTSLNHTFPKYEITLVTGSDTTLQEKVAAEQNIKQLGCDILICSDPSYALQLKEKNMLHQYQSSIENELAFSFTGDGFWYPVGYTTMVLGYNPLFYAREDLPNSYHSFAFDSTINNTNTCTMANPVTTAASLASLSALKDKYGYGFFEALGKQNLYIESNSAALAKLESGESRIALISEDAILKKREQENSKLEIIYPLDGVVTISLPIMIISDDWSLNHNAKICEELVEWFLSAEGQEYIAGSFIYPVRSDSECSLDHSKPKNQHAINTTPVNWENCYRQRDELLTKFEQYVPLQSKNPT